MANNILCPQCDHKPFRNESGLAWHLERVHQAEVAEPESQVDGSDRVTEQQASMLEDRLQKLEYITGLREVDLDDLLDDTELPLTDRLTNITERVTKLSDTVSKLNEAVEVTAVTKAMMDAQIEEFSKRLTDLREAHNRQASRIDEHRDYFNNNFAVVVSRIDKLQEMVQDLGQGLNEIKTKLTTHGHDNLKSIPELVAKVGKIEQTLGSMQSQVDYLGRVTKREPTSDTESIRLTNGRDHTFRVYKSSRGLTQPHRVARDFILGDKYVDLTEPED